MPMPTEMGLEFSAVEQAPIISGIQQAIDAIKAKKIVQLTAEERQGGQSVAEKRQPYVHKAIDNLAPAYPALQPGYLSLANAQMDLHTSEFMNTVKLMIKELDDRATDFGIAAEHHSYVYTRKLYANGKEAQPTNTPGADVVVDELSPLFEKESNLEKPEPEPIPPTPPA